jgi:NNP family nitrate/nitrite transporter-like MFS transporter
MIGGLGGFFLPIAFGALNDLTGLWSSCFMLLFAIVVGLVVWMDVSIRRMEREVRAPSAPVPAQALYAAE